ncbi:MAG: sugar phosphate nucleotidyltransferase [Anaerolineae bacterium]|jgi:glucose-1-phosphate cytidylyltransferase
MKTETSSLRDSSLPVIVLCGGEGSRMQAPTNKVLVEIGGRPILWHVMKIYASYGHARFVLALGHQAEGIKRYFLEYEPMSYDFTIQMGQSCAITYHGAETEDWEVTLADTGPHALKGARVYRAAKYIDTDTFFVTYGEAVGDVDIDALLAFHRQHGRLATVTGARMWSHLGVFQLDENGDGQVVGFAEKPVLDHWINAGFMLFERGVLDYLDDEDSFQLEKDGFPRLVADGQLMMYRHSGYWRSMKTFKDAQELDAIWRESAPWKTWN